MGTGLRVRFCSGRTAGLDVEAARTALFNWLAARSGGGRFVVRIESRGADPLPRGAEERILDDLRWLGLGWDEGPDVGGDHGPYRRSDRLSLYRAQAERLIAERAAYPCFCPAPSSAEGRACDSPSCLERCRSIDPAEARDRRAREPSVIRFDIDAAAASGPTVVFNDLVRGEFSTPVSHFDDFVLLQAGGWPTSLLATAADDFLMGISHTIRSEAYLPDAPRHALILRALGGSEPALFVHLPRITGRDAATPAGSEEATTVSRLREQGYPPTAVVNYLALLGWSPATGQELLTPEELIGGFNFGRIVPEPVVWDPRRLDALSARHLFRMDPERLAPLAAEQLIRSGLLSAPISQELMAWVGSLALVYSEQLEKMTDLPHRAGLVLGFDPEASLADPEVDRSLADPSSRRVIETLVEQIEPGPVTASRFQALAAEVRRRTGAKGRDLYEPMRIALTGRSHGPELVKLLPVIEEGSRLLTPRRVPSCAQRARALLAATVGEGR